MVQLRAAAAVTELLRISVGKKVHRVELLRSSASPQTAALGKRNLSLNEQPLLLMRMEGTL